MKRRRILYTGIGVAALLLAGIFAAQAVLSRTEKGVAVSEPNVAAVSGAHGGQAETAAHAEEGQAEEGKEKPDLDRPVDEMWAQKCEHKIPQYQCDECRYEIGAVKIAQDVLAEGGKPGLVKVAAAGGGSFDGSRTFPAEVAFSDARTVHVVSPLPGIVRKVLVDVGTRVAAGAPLVEIDSHDVVEAKGEYLKKESARDLADKTLERERKLFAKKISAEVEVQEAEARRAEAEVELSNARLRLHNLGIPDAEIDALDRKSPGRTTGLLVVRAPQAGAVVERHASLGERVEAGKDLFLLSDLSEVWVWVDLREGDVQALAGRSGRIAAEVLAPGGRTYRGMLDVLSEKMSEETRTIKGRVVVQNPGGALRPGMFVTVRLKLSGPSGGLAVPKVAVLSDEGRPFVFVHKEGDYWVRRPVTLGKSSRDMVEITRGLQPGQKIVADGSFLLKSDVLRKKMGAGCAD